MKKIFILSSLFILFACKEKSDKPVYQSDIANIDIFKVRVSDVLQTSGTGIIQATGILSSDLESKPAFKTGGVVLRTYFKEGDRIQKGSLLATLNMSEIQAQVDQAKRAVEKTNRDLNRVKNLYADSVATLEQMQNTQTAYDMSLESLKIVEFNQTYSKVIAPESGIVMKKIVQEGEIVGPGMPVCLIMGIGQQHWIIKAAVADKEWAQVKKGDKAVVKFEAFTDMNFDGIVDKIADMANPGTATLDIEIKLLKPVQKLAAGLIASVTIQSSAASSNSRTTIPIEALVSSNDGKAIVYLPREGKAVRTSISIDKILGKEVTVSSGLEGVKQVITAGAVYLQDGDKIEIVN